MWQQLKVLDLKIIFTALDDIKLPFFKENALRSALGTSLRSTICVTPLRENCTGCDIENLCVYNKLFSHPPGGIQNTKTQNQDIASLSSEFSPLPSSGRGQKENLSPIYLSFFDPDTLSLIHPGEKFVLNLRLFGPAVAYFPYFYYCLENMASRGLGLKDCNSKRGKFEMNEVIAKTPDGVELPVYCKDKKCSPARLHPFSLSDYIHNRTKVTALRIKTLSPLRLKHKNRLVSSPELHILLRASLRRISDIYFKTIGKYPQIDYAKLVARASASNEITQPEGQWEWFDYDRYSSTQRTNMKLGGIVGDFVYRGELSDFYPFLKAGEVLAIGKGIAFGFGRYEIKIER